MKRVFLSSLAVLVLAGAARAVPPQAPPSQPPPQAPPVAKVAYATAYYDALKANKPLITAVGCPCPDVPGCICCEVDTLAGYGRGVHIAVVTDGKLQYVGQLGQHAGTSTMMGGTTVGGDCSTGACGPTGSYGGYGAPMFGNYGSFGGNGGGSCASGSCGSSGAGARMGIFRGRRVVATPY